MTTYRLSFRFERQDYSQDARAADNDRLKLNLRKQLEERHITVTYLHTPSRNSIKAIFDTEDELNKVLSHKESLEHVGFYPKLSKIMKTRRTVFCSGFDPTLLQTYNKDDIQDLLEKDDWVVAGIHIMNDYRSFKIEFNTIYQALQFLENSNTSIGGIKIHQRHKEKEIDTTVDQCWGCGLLQPDHKSQNCQGSKLCLYCGSLRHKFYDCVIPRKFDDMTNRHKAMRYCTPCNMTGDHTSLDHSLCPKKKEIIQERIRAGREKREDEIKSDDKDMTRIKNVIDLTLNETWPNLNLNKQQTQVTTILSMALIDEAFNPGVFQDKFNRSCESNGILPVKYTLEPNTAKEFVKTMSGARDLDSTQEFQTLTKQLSERGKSQTPSMQLSKYCRDQMGGKKYQTNLDKFNLDMEKKLGETHERTKGKIDMTPKTHRLNNTNNLNDISFGSTPDLTQCKTTITPETLRLLKIQHMNQKQMTESLEITDDSSSTSLDDDSGMLYKSRQLSLISSLVASRNQYTSTEISAILDYLM